MSKGYVVANIRVTDQDRFQEFSGMAGPAIKKYGGRVLARGPGADRLEGDVSGIVMMIEFESNDEYDNRFTDYNNLDYPILEFPKIKHFSNAVGDYMTTVFNRIVGTDYFKQKTILLS